MSTYKQRITNKKKKRQYAILWCIVFSFLVVMGGLSSSKADQITLELEIDYGINAALSVVGPSSVVFKDGYYYNTGYIELEATTSLDADSTIETSEADGLFSGATSSSGTAFSHIIGGTDRLLSTSGLAIASTSGFRGPYNVLQLFKDTTPPTHSGAISKVGNNIYEEFLLSRSAATDTGVGNVTYGVSIAGTSGPGSGFLFSTIATTNSLLIGSGIFYPGDYDINVIAFDGLFNSSPYPVDTTSFIAEVIITTSPSGGGGGGGGGGSSSPGLAGLGGDPAYDICLCGDYSGLLDDFRCSPIGEDESLYTQNYCETLFDDPDGENLTDEFLDQWIDIISRFLDVLGGIPSSQGASIKLPNEQVIVGEGGDSYWNQLHIILQREWTGSIEIDRPYIQGTLQDGFLYITYIEPEEEEKSLCVNCCYNYQLPYNIPHNSDTLQGLFLYLRWCEPIYLLLLLLLAVITRDYMRRVGKKDKEDKNTKQMKKEKEK